jgi:hypothetical protein
MKDGFQQEKVMKASHMYAYVESVFLNQTFVVMLVFSKDFS